MPGMLRRQNGEHCLSRERPERGTSLYNSLKAKRRSRVVVARELGRGGGDLFNGYRVSAWQDEKNFGDRGFGGACRTM